MAELMSECSRLVRDKSSHIESVLETITANISAISQQCLQDFSDQMPEDLKQLEQQMKTEVTAESANIRLKVEELSKTDVRAICESPEQSSAGLKTAITDIVTTVFKVHIPAVTRSVKAFRNAVKTAKTKASANAKAKAKANRRGNVAKGKGQSTQVVDEFTVPQVALGKYFDENLVSHISPLTSLARCL